MFSGRFDRRGAAIADLTLLLTVLLVVVGIELTTRAVSVAAVRLQEGLLEITRTGETSHVPTLRFWSGAVLLVVAGFIGTLRTARLFAVRSLSDQRCPECGEETRRIRRKALHRMASPVLGLHVSRRSCSECGWVGLAKDN